jgi:hypothetical protein
MIIFKEALQNRDEKRKQKSNIEIFIMKHKRCHLQIAG